MEEESVEKWSFWGLKRPFLPWKLTLETKFTLIIQAISVPREEKAGAFHEEEKRLQKFPGVTNLNRNEGIDHSQQSTDFSLQKVKVGL